MSVVDREKKKGNVLTSINVTLSYYEDDWLTMTFDRDTYLGERRLFKEHPTQFV